jgi:uncharacterized protein (DUF1800 family)
MDLRTSIAASDPLGDRFAFRTEFASASHHFRTISEQDGLMATSSSAPTAQTWAITARVLRRTGFGVTGAEVDAVAATPIATLVDQLLAADPASDPGAVATPAPTFARVTPLAADADVEARKTRNALLADQLAQLEAWWLKRMVAVRQPFGEKLTFIWHGHFATAASKVRSAPMLALQNQKLRELGRGDFRTLALAMTVDPAMLFWLDGQQNTVQAPNENLAREFMELFALGVDGGYTETDVREGARALTGWRIDADNLTAMLVPKQHDIGSKTVLGVTGNLDQVGFVDAVLARPASAQHVVARTWGTLCGSAPLSAASLARFVSAYGAGRSLRSMLAAMLTSAEFTAAAGTVVVSPVEWAIGAARALKVPVDKPANVAIIADALRQLGQVPFNPPNVSGWPSGQAWLSTAAADARLQVATRLVKVGDISAVTSAAPGARLDPLAHLLGIATWTDRSAAALTPLASDPPSLVAAALATSEYLTH